MKKLILSALLISVSAGSYAQKLPGTADSTFNGNGYSVFNFGAKSTQLFDGSSVGAIDKDGKLLIYGSSTDYSNKKDCGLIRINNDGKPDMSFRFNAGPSGVDFNSGENDYINTIAQSASGEITAIGGFTGANSSDLLVVRFKEDGTVQTNFGLNGVNKFEVSSEFDVARHAIVDGNYTVILGNLPTVEKKMYMIRLFPYGGIDSSFGTGGIVYLDPLDRNNTPVALLKRPDGGYYVVCNTSGNGESLISVISVSKNGNYNIDLGGPGMVHLKIDGKDALASDAAYHNGSIFICGHYASAQGNDDGFLARLEKDGTWNSTFAGNGFARIVHNLSNPYDESSARLVIAPDSSIFVASLVNTPDTVTLIQSRFKSDGNVDGLYGNHNGSHYDFGIVDTVTSFSINDLILDTASKRLYVIGDQYTPSHSGFYVYATYTGEFKEASSGGGGTGIHQKASHLKVYPNPASSWLQLDLPESDELEVRVYDLQGREVMQSTSSLLDVNELNRGIYIIRAVQANQLYTAKIQVLDK